MTIPIRLSRMQLLPGPAGAADAATGFSPKPPIETISACCIRCVKIRPVATTRVSGPPPTTATVITPPLDDPYAPLLVSAPLHLHECPRKQRGSLPFHSPQDYDYRGPEGAVRITGSLKN